MNNNYEELDFAYLLELMRPLKSIPEYALLPELFAVIGYDKLRDLCRYAGGEAVKIPTVEELSEAIVAMQWFYQVKIKHDKLEEQVPENIKGLYLKICRVYKDDT